MEQEDKIEELGDELQETREDGEDKEEKVEESEEIVKDNKDEEEEEIPEEPVVIQPSVPTCITNDKLEKMLYGWILSLHISILFSWLGIFSCWKVLFITLGVATSLYILAMATYKISPLGRCVLITGCDTGFGHALALKLDQLGFTVIACCLSDKCEGAESLRSEGSELMHVLQMDVCREDDVRRARAQVDEIVSEGKLWGLVNNAGISTFGDLEWVPESTFRKITEVNLLGMVRVTKAFLPLVRKAKGRIVNLSSMLGRMGGPMRSPYVMTKYGVEGLSECLRHEMKPWEVNVILVEPGNFISGTQIFTDESVAKMADDMWSQMNEEVKNDYTEEFFQTRVELMKGYVGGGLDDVSPVITSLVESLTQEFPQVRYQPGEWTHKFRIFASTHLPEFIYDHLYCEALTK